MASNVLKHRVKEDQDTKRREKRRMVAKRGLRSLGIAIGVPLSLSVLSACIGSFSSSNWRKPFLFPPSWALHLTCPASTFLMSISAWMVWADGGFHTNPTALFLYLTQLLLTLLWDPIVFAFGSTRFGFLLSLALLLTQFACMRLFRPLNPIAADFVKPCFAWVAFLSILNLKLLFV